MDLTAGVHVDLMVIFEFFKHHKTIGYQWGYGSNNFFF